jgi:hypothetical protein
MATTTTYGLNKPTVGGDENTWGGLTNDNWDDVDDLLDGTTPITPNLGAGWEVGGVAVTATAAEINILDGVTASTSELNILDGVTWTLTDYNTLTATAAELNILDGATLSTAELNILDGVTSTAAELNILDGVTATASEINALDGVTATGTAVIQAADAAAARTAISFNDGLNASGSAPLYAARAWVVFAGATGSVTASGNVSSVTRSGAGQYTINFTSALPTASYVPSVLTDGGTIFVAIGVVTTSTCVINTRNSSGTLTDPNSLRVAFIGG